MFINDNITDRCTRSIDKCYGYLRKIPLIRKNVILLCAENVYHYKALSRSSVLLWCRDSSKMLGGGHSMRKIFDAFDFPLKTRRCY